MQDGPDEGELGLDKDGLTGVEKYELVLVPMYRAVERGLLPMLLAVASPLLYEVWRLVKQEASYEPELCLLWQVKLWPAYGLWLQPPQLSLLVMQGLPILREGVSNGFLPPTGSSNDFDIPLGVSTPAPRRNVWDNRSTTLDPDGVTTDADP